jgi:hypothetical protein
VRRRAIPERVIGQLTCDGLAMNPQLVNFSHWSVDVVAQPVCGQHHPLGIRFDRANKL